MNIPKMKSYLSKIALATLCLTGTCDALAAVNTTANTSVWPVMVRMDYNPVMNLKMQADGETLTGIDFDLKGTTKISDIASIDVYFGGDTSGKIGEKFGSAKITGNPKVSVMGRKKLANGANELWVSVKMKKNADIEGKIVLAVTGATINSRKQNIKGAQTVQRIGYAIAKAGDLGSKNYRIPAIARNPKTGTLIATFDIRYNHGGDLPANIDVGVCRSENGGKTWTPVESVLSSKGMEVEKGIGDPGILVDDKTGKIWISALWAPQSGHPIWSSSTGTDSPQECGQMVLISSDNDGKSWSKPINITSGIKRLKDSDTKDWGLVFQGPGAGICTKDGTLIFPSQIWGHKGKGVKGVLVYSKDGGKTWTSSKAMPWGGSESTCVQLKDGSIMLNVRQGSPGARIVATTKDMGETWKKFDGENLRQPGNLCQAALLTADGKNLYFSNPNSGARNNMTLKHSKDGGKTWSEGLLYDERRCAGYSTLAFADDKNQRIGVLYEGTPDAQTLFFLSIPADEVRKAK